MPFAEQKAPVPQIEQLETDWADTKGVEGFCSHCGHPVGGDGMAVAGFALCGVCNDRD